MSSIDTRAAPHVRIASVRLNLCSAISIMKTAIRSWITTSVRLDSWSVILRNIMVIEMMSVISVHPSPFWSKTSWRNMNISSSLDISVRMQTSHSIINIRIIINSVIEIVTYHSINIERASVCYDECIINSSSSINLIDCFNWCGDCGGCRAARCECCGRQNQSNEEHQNLFHNQNHQFIYSIYQLYSRKCLEVSLKVYGEIPKSPEGKSLAVWFGGFSSIWLTNPSSHHLTNSPHLLKALFLPWNTGVNHWPTLTAQPCHNRRNELHHRFH